MPPEPYIDAHAHVWTPDVRHYPLADGFVVGDMKPASFTAGELLAICRPSGVGRVNLIQMSFYGTDNRYMLDMVGLHPDRFVGTAIIDVNGPHPGRAMTELEPRGVRAFRIRPGDGKAKARWLVPEGYKAMFAKGGKSGLALSCLIDPGGFPEVDRMCRAFPDTPVVIDHLGRIGLDGVIRDDDVESLCALAAHPRVYVKVGAFYALGKKEPPYLDLAPLIRRVVKAFGARRCMWESDCPFQVDAHTYANSFTLIKDRLDFLTPEDREWLLWRTAEKLLFRPPA